MLDLLFNDPLTFIGYLFSLLIAVAIHEYAHAKAADLMGDPTPRLNGRLTLNPLAHLDPIGTLALIIAHVGWGKPVPIDPYNLRNPRKDSALISLAGPASNLILAVILSLIFRFFPFFKISFLISFFYPLIIINVGLGVFNLIPIPPLDGAKIVLGFLPLDVALKFEETMSSYGLILLIFLLFPMFGGASLFSIIISPIIQTILRILLFTA